MGQQNYGVRKRSAAAGQFEVADVTMTTARQRAQELSTIDKRRAYVVVDVNTDHVFATFMNGKAVS